MPWLLPAVIASFSGTLVLVFVYWYLALDEQDPAVRKWAIGWSLYALRFVFALLALLTAPHPLLKIANLSATLLSGYFLLWGTCLYLDRPLHRMWGWLVGAIEAWIVWAGLTEASFQFFSLPPYLFLGAVYIWTGIILLRHVRHRGFIGSLSGWTFILWGVHKMDYPFLRPIAWAAPWGYLLGSIFEVVAALAILLDYFQRNKQALVKAVDKAYESERKFRRLVESTSTIPWEINLQTYEFTYVGKQIEKAFGYPASSWKDLDTWASRVHPDDREAAVAFCTQETQAGRDHDFEYRMVCKDGRLRWVHDIVSVIKGSGEEGNAPQRLVGFMQDITTQKKAEEEKRIAERRLEQAQKMEAIGTLAGGIAHDFNNILSAILGYAELARDEAAPDSSVAQDLDRVLEASIRARELVKQILAFSRQGQTGKQPVPLAPLVKEALKMIRASIPTTISIVAEISPEAGVVVADPTQLHQVMINLCTNAYHAMEDGGTLTVGLRAERLEQDLHQRNHVVRAGEYSVLRVADTGHGIAPDMIDKIFDPYFTTKEIGKGTGLGLSIVHGIVHDCGGEILVQSQADAGTVFTIYLPRVHQEAAVEKNRQDEVPMGRERILLVDDEPMLVDVGMKILQGLGYEVSSCRGGREALERLRTAPDAFDLLITDQTMPEITGLMLAKEVQGLRPDLPVILCTGYSAGVDEKSAKDAGIRQVAMKPLTRESLSRVVRDVLDAVIC